MENIIPSFGAFESPKDKRDIKHTELVNAGLISSSFDIDYSNQPVLNQGKKGICTAIALTQMIEKMYGGNIRLSYAFLYKVGKKIYDQNKIEGSCLRTMLKVAYNYGIPKYELAPYDINQSYDDFMAMPDFGPEIYIDAKNYMIGGFASVPIDKDSIAKNISNNPYGLYTRIVAGNTWYTDAQGNITWDKNKLSPLRVVTKVDGGHAILKRKYDYSNGMMTRDRNTWGDQWCDKGEIDILDFNDQITEAWVISKKPIVQSFDTDIKFGMTGDNVKNLQTALKIEGFFNYSITGYFGPITWLAVKAFQKSNGIITTGYVGPLTRTKLNSIFQ